MRYFLLFAVIFLIRCNADIQSDKPDELIDFLRLESNRTDSINVDEVFFAKKYDLKFKSNQNVFAEYSRKSGKIVLKPSSDFSGLTFIQFSNNDENLVLPVIVNKKTAVYFSHRPDQKQNAIYVMGNFNNWNRKADAMNDADGNGTYEAVLYLDEGVYEYQFVLDNREIYDLSNTEKVDNGYGSFNSIKRVMAENKGRAAGLFFIPGDQEDIINFAVVPGARSKKIRIFGLIDNQIIADNVITHQGARVKLDLQKLPSDNRIHTIRLLATGNDQPGNIISVWVKNGKLLPAENRLWQDAMIYSLMVDRFSNGDPDNDQKIEHPDLADQANFRGGDLSGIINKLESGYFDSLGINAIWISPVNKTTNMAYREWPEPKRYFSGYHGYWPVSATIVEPRFGTMTQMKKLVNIAHRHKIKILLDFISNHTHKEHPLYQNNKDWFGLVDLPDGEKNIRRWEEYRLTTWFDTFLPSFDYLGSPEAMETMTDNAVWWIKETGIDGFRHDATKHVPYQFWRTLTQKIKSQSDKDRALEIYQIGETFGGFDLIKSYVNNGMLDAQFSFNQFFTARRIFAEESGHFQDLAGTIEKALKIYGDNHLMGNIMDSHDQVRMMALLDGQLTLSDDAVERAWKSPPIVVNHPESYEKAYMLLTYLFTVPGIPILYYGDEFGITGANDPDNRRMMRFGADLSDMEEKHLRKIQKLIKLRGEISGLRRGDFHVLYVTKDVLIYTRGDARERHIIALNKGNQAAAITLKLPEWIKAGELKSRLGGGKILVKRKKAELLLSPYSSDILQINP